ncbi:MAG: C40 family peptidase [Lactobacillus crispatus]|nr:C40 family peptidase [Lactobacillus crispatus]
MNFKRNLAKISAATAFALAGVATVNTLNAPTSVHAATLPYAVKINYVPGYGIAVWNNYNNPELIAGKKLAHGTAWRVFAQATDSNGELWYNLGGAQWIMAKYTLGGSSNTSSSSNVSASSNNGSSSSASNTTQATTSSAAKVVSLASAQLGKAYVWGGNGPSAFDCSGLVNYVYSQVGISLGRTTYVQVNHGTTVSMNNLQPGDLLFWGSASAPYHVGIYVGNGQYIHAAIPSQGVIKQSISQYFYPSVAKRVL